jgi:spermidine/putrescine transport system substrate-binding protein
MKRRVLARVAAASVVLVIAAACSNSGSSSPEATGGGSSATTNPADITGTIRLLSYSDGFDPNYLASFHQEYPNIKLETASMDSNEAAIAKIQAGFQVDVINSCVDEATLEMVQKGLYMPLDPAKLTNWPDLFPSMKELPGVQVDGKIYMVPVDAGTAGLLYNADVVSPPPDSWTDLFDPQWQGRAGLEDIAVTAFMVGALANGITDPLHMDQSQLDSVKNYLIDHKDQFRTFWHGDAEVKSLFKSGEIVISSGYPDEAKFLQKEGVNAQFAVAKEGQFLWACGYGISPSIDPENLPAAYALLNWYSGIKAEMFEASYWGYQIANEKVLDVAPKSLVQEAGLDAPFHLENAIPASPPENRDAWVAAWAEVKAS